MSINRIMFLASVLVVSSRPAQADDGVLVHIESNAPGATLERVIAEGTTVASGPGGTATASSVDYAMVCTVPCDKVIDRNAKYVMRGVSGWAETSDTFLLPARSSVILKVESRSQTTYRLGFLGAVVGGMGVGVGGVALLVSLNSSNAFVREPALIITGISTPILIAGIVAMMRNETNISTETGQELTQLVPKVRRGVVFTGTGVAGAF